MLVSENEGGCWFCSTDQGDDWLFSFEFGTFLHEKCLIEEIELGNEEALIMMDEFGLD